MWRVHGTKNHSDQSGTFTHLKTVLNACIEYDLQSAWYWESRELLAISKRPSWLRINPQRKFSPFRVHSVHLHCLGQQCCFCCQTSFSNSVLSCGQPAASHDFKLSQTAWNREAAMTSDVFCTFSLSLTFSFALVCVCVCVRMCIKSMWVSMATHDSLIHPDQTKTVLW